MSLSVATGVQKMISNAMNGKMDSRRPGLNTRWLTTNMVALEWNISNCSRTSLFSISLRAFAHAVDHSLVGLLGISFHFKKSIAVRYGVKLCAYRIVPFNKSR